MHAQIMLIESTVSRTYIYIYIYDDIEGMMCVVFVARRLYLISYFGLQLNKSNEVWQQCVNGNVATEMATEV